MATYNVETWLYYGVAEGIHKTAGGMNDPTTWILELIAKVFHGQGLFFAIEGLTIIFSAMTAVLVYLCVKKVADNKIAIYASLIYAFLPGPLDLSVSGFTHDLLLNLMFFACIYSFLLATSLKKRVYQAIFLIFGIYLVKLGLAIHKGILVAPAVVLIYIFFRALSERKMDHENPRTLFFAGFFILGLCLVPHILDAELARLPQGISGSEDVGSVSFADLILRYHLLIPLIFWGIFIADKKKEYLGISILCFGILFSLSMDRGTRVIDLAIPFLIGYPFTERKKMSKILTGSFLAVPVSAYFLTDMGWTVFSIVGVGSYVAYKLGCKNQKQDIVLIFIVTSICLVVSGFIINQDRVVDGAEYELYRYAVPGLNSTNILCSWDKGYAISSISGAKTFSDAGTIDKDVHSIFWLTEDIAHNILSKNNISHIIFKKDSFGISEVEGVRYYELKGGLILGTEKRPPIDFAQYTLAYKLRYGKFDPQLFEGVMQSSNQLSEDGFEIFRVKEHETKAQIEFISGLEGANSTEVNISLTLFESEKKPKPKVIDVVKELAFEPQNIIGCVLKNTVLFLILVFFMHLLRGLGNNEKTIVAIVIVLLLFLASNFIYLADEMEASTYDSERTISKRINLTKQMIKGLNIYKLPVDEIPSGGCKLSYGDEAGGYKIKMMVENLCGVDELFEIGLVDKDVSRAFNDVFIEDKVSPMIPMSSTVGNVTLNFRFTRDNPLHGYDIAYKGEDCIRVHDFESFIEGPELYWVFC